MKRGLILAALVTLILAACSPTQQAGGGGHPMKLAPMSMLTPEVQKAPVKVREAYQYAIANAEVLKQIPCYCGCGSMGHKSNLDCYIKEFKPDGSVVLETHALGCSLCVDITQDVMSLASQGKPVADIRAAIVSTFSKFGPSNQ